MTFLCYLCLAIGLRKANKITSLGRNIALFEFIDDNGNLIKKAFVSNPKAHSEAVGLAYLRENNIPNESVKRIYTEREPCILTATNDANCAGMIKIQFPNSKVEYSIDYGDTPEHGKIAKEELKKLIEQFVGGE
ncbi:hypothetical protein D3C77_538890 [compost metagenome]